MPVLDGLQACQQIRNMEAQHAVSKPVGSRRQASSENGCLAVGQTLDDLLVQDQSNAQQPVGTLINMGSTCVKRIPIVGVSACTRTDKLIRSPCNGNNTGLHPDNFERQASNATDILIPRRRDGFILLHLS